jgi:hypothetical protein
MTSIYSRFVRAYWLPLLLLVLLMFAVCSQIASAQVAASGTGQIKPITVEFGSTTTTPGAVQAGSINFDSSKVTLTPSNVPSPSNNDKLEVQSGANPDMRFPPKYGVYGPRGESRPLCGGVVDGKLQAPCAGKVAIFESDAVGKCSAGSFFDLGTWSCYSCPTGYERSLTAVTGERACQKADSNVKGKLTSATLRGTVCPKGSFFDPTRQGECWSCPQGFNRSAAPVEWADACVKPAAEIFAPTTKRGNATGLLKAKCPTGQHAKGGSCFSCPSGYNRTLNAMESDKACAQVVKVDKSNAKLIKQAICEPGEIRDKLRDPKHGGECWTCPTAATRTVFPINGGKACQIGGNFKYAGATQTSALSCPAGQMFDLVNSKHPKVQTLLRKQGGSFPANLGKGGGGSCWSCPAGYRRTAFAAWNPGACESIGTDWRSATYTQPGLFGLDGAEDVAKEILTTRPELIIQIAKSIAPSLKMSVADVIRDSWDDIAIQPEESAILKTAVYSRLQAAAAEPAKASAAEKRLLASFAEAMMRFRSYLAQEALSAGEAWQQVKLIKKAQSRTVMQGDATVLFTDLPNFEDITTSAVLGGLATGTGLSALAVSGIVKNVSMDIVFPFRNRGRTAGKIGSEAAEAALKKLSSTVTKEVADAAAKAAEKAAIKAASKSASAMLKGLMSGGVAILIEVVSEFVVISVDKALQEANLIPSLKAKLATAQQKVDVARLLATDAGANELDSQWAIMMGEATLPKDLNAIAQKARAAGVETQAISASLASEQATASTAAVPKFAIASIGMGGLCVDESGAAVVMKPCAVASTSWSVGAGKTLRSSSSGKCLIAVSPVILGACPATSTPLHQWQLVGQAISAGTGLCLEGRGAALVMSPCSAKAPAQLWRPVVK